MQIVDCTFESHSESILSILNDAIATTTAIYDETPRTIETMREWFSVKTAKSYPVLGLVNDSEQFVAFSTYGPFRPLFGYRFTVEHSVYVHRDHRHHGYGRRMLSEIIARAKVNSVHTMIGVIDSSNDASIALHTSMGFTHTGTLREVGFKFDRWLDVMFFQLVLES
jgi:L-amino acid N-acyltransferase